jgi:hypothetical protein
MHSARTFAPSLIERYPKAKEAHMAHIETVVLVGCC